MSDYDAGVDFDLRETEPSVKHHPKTAQGARMDEQARADLVSWMDGFTRRFGLAPGTLRRAVSYVDRVLSARTLPAASSDYEYELGLLGAAAVFTAAKYEERSTVSKLNAAEIARYCGFATGKEVVDMERQMLAALRYELGCPTACAVVDNFTGEQDLEIRSTSIVDYGCLQFAVAASTVFLLLSIVFAVFSECISMESLVFEI